MVSSRKHSFRHMYVILLCPLLQQQCPPAGHLPNPGIKPRTSTSQEDFIYHLSHQGIPRSWSGVPFPPPGNLPNQEIEPASLMSPELAGGCFTTNTTCEAPSSQSLSMYNIFLFFLASPFDIQDLSQPGIEPTSPALGAQRPNHWTTREISLTILKLFTVENS